MNYSITNRKSQHLTPNTQRPTFALLLLLCLCGCRQPAVGQTVTWNPTARQQAESDTLFMPDLTSAQTIEDAGGFLSGPREASKEATLTNFKFGPGKYGPAVQSKLSEYGKPTFVYYPVDGLMPSDEFTLEFWARSDTPWSSVPQSEPIFGVVSPEGNALRVVVAKNSLNIQVVAPGSTRQWSRPLEALRVDDTNWHSIAMTLKQGEITIYIDGAEAGKLEKIQFLPVWSDEPGSNAGIDLGGVRANSSGFWLSDLRISRTARVPSRPVLLHSPDGALKLDASASADHPMVLQIGGLHPYGTPEQIPAALSVVRTDKFLSATPIVAGPPDANHPSAGHSGKYSYDWEVVDRNLAWYREHHVGIYFNFDSTPALLGGSHPPLEGEALHTYLSRRAVFNTNPPTDLNVWATIVSDAVYHIHTEKQTPIAWYAAWNEPSQNGPFWTGTMEQYLDVYVATARAIRSVDPEARIGGPEGANAKWTKALIDRCAAEKVPLDYISQHYFTGNLASLFGFRAETDAFTRAAGLKTPMPIVIGEFNWDQHVLYKPGTPLPFRESPWNLRALGAAYLTAAMNLMAQLPEFQLMIYAHIGGGINASPRAGGWVAAQILGPNNEQWAPYNVLKGWRQTVGKEVLHYDVDLPPGVTALATRDSDRGRYGLVFSNYGYCQRSAHAVTMTISHLPAGRYELARALVDPKHSSRWDVAEDRPEGASQNDLQTVEQRTLTVEKSGTLTLQVVLPAWSSTFITLTPHP